MNDEMFRNELTRQARQEARERFSEDRFYNNVALLYSKQLKGIRQRLPA
jgi:hypothetical protein